uniref:Cytochrome c oxidase subunit 3 n=1 Tax=Cimbex luteus TaxID=1384799 RepID=A0A7T1C5H5_9HYME|nr:cytochrome c oxidase subunit III [Cimbex luteus]QPM99417.2 cytochrome c oxidase subunit III [Cimbex luteus]UXW64282.1 cytochrome c oxidase subunit III [Cimbex luteus]
MSKMNHPFHLVDYSPWPLLGSLSTMIMLLGSIKWFHYKNSNLMLLGMLITSMIMFQWWRDIIRESTFQGNRTTFVKFTVMYIKYSIWSYSTNVYKMQNWAFFHSSISPNIEIGGIWPPNGIKTFNPMHVPLLNTIILISSGFTITWSHHSIMNNKKNEAMSSLLITVILGILFTLLQKFEYNEASFSIADSIYGSTFFLTTGFHGLHVLIGTIFLFINLMRLKMNHFSLFHHFGFEASAWYWHFVDVVWLFLYISIYWWGK